MDSPDPHSNEAPAEGWYLDPYDRHEQRWFSAGTPTDLVRDGGVDSKDDPPGPLPHAPQEIPEETSLTGGADLRRADEAEAAGQSTPGMQRAGEVPPRSPYDAAIESANKGPYN
jgi:hypothetical protein